MSHDFRAIDEANIDRLSALFEDYSGRPLDKAGIIRSSQLLPCWSIWRGDTPTGFYHTLRFAPDILKLVNIFVTKEGRGKGHGSAMLSHLFEVMRPPFTGVIAANSALFATRETKMDPQTFYARNGFAMIAQTDDTKIFWKRKA